MFSEKRLPGVRGSLLFFSSSYAAASADEVYLGAVKKLRDQKKISIFGVALLIASVIFAAILPVRAASSYHSHKYAYQTQIENLAISANSEWQQISFSVKTPLLGTIWLPQDQVRSCGTLRIEALFVNPSEYSPHFVTPTIHAP